MLLSGSRAQLGQPTSAAIGVNENRASATAAACASSPGSRRAASASAPANRVATATGFQIQYATSGTPSRHNRPLGEQRMREDMGAGAQLEQVGRKPVGPGIPHPGQVLELVTAQRTVGAGRRIAVGDQPNDREDHRDNRPQRQRGQQRRDQAAATTYRPLGCIRLRGHDLLGPKPRELRTHVRTPPDGRRALARSGDR